MSGVDGRIRPSDHERRDPDGRQDPTDVRRVDHVDHRGGGSGTDGMSLVASPRLTERDVICVVRVEQVDHHPRAPRPSSNASMMSRRLVDGESPRIVIGARQSREPVDKDESVHAVRVRRGEHAGEEPTGHRGHDGCLLAPDVVEHGPQVVHPLFERRKRRRRHGIRQADAALVETDHTRERGQTIVEPRERSDLALDLDVAEPLLGHDDVYATRAEGSIGDMDVTALRVPGGARHRAPHDFHGSLTVPELSTGYRPSVSAARKE